MKNIIILLIIILAVKVNGQNTFTYDYLNRLKTKTLSNGSQIQYTYDELGNRMTKTVSIEPITQNAPKTNAGSVSSCPGGSISIHITVSDFNQITAVSLRMDYNPVLMSYSSYSNLNSAFTGAIINHVQVNESLSKVIFVWINVNPQSLANGSKMFDLNFSLIQGSPVLAFNNTSNGSSDCEFADANGNPLNDMPTSTFYTNSTVTNLSVANAGLITGPAQVYHGQLGIPYSISAIVNAASYVWNYSGTGVTINNGSSNTVNLDFSQNATSGNLTVYGTNNCGNGAVSQAFQISVSDYPAVHIIDIPNGWSGLSSWVVPHSNSIESIFNPIIGNLTIVQTLNAIYYPSQTINTIGTWANQSAYKLKVTNNCLLNITGFENMNKTLNLNSGWNLSPVICNVPVDPVQLFSALVNDLKIAKDIAGSGVYWPEYGINSIGSLLPGKAYFVKMNNAGTITFPQNDFSGLKTSDFQKEPVQPSPWGWIYKTPSSHIFALPANITHQFSDNSFIGIFTPEGVCAGTCFVNKGHSTVLVANPDDPLTAQKDGFVDGEPLSVRLWDAVAGKEYLLQVEYDLNQPDHSGIFAANGISAISEIQILTDIQEEFLKGIMIFPNPTNGKLNISGIASGIEIMVTIFSSTGKSLQVIALKNDGAIDVSHLSAGVYFVKLEDGNSVRFEKVVVE